MIKFKKKNIIISLLTLGTFSNIVLEKKQISSSNTPIVIENFHDFETTNTSFSSTVSETTTTKTTESEFDKYQDILFLYNIDSSYTLEMIDDIIIKYSFYSHFSYNEAINIINDNLDFIIDGLNNNSFPSVECGIVTLLFDKAYEMGILSKDCPNNKIETRDMNRDEKEELMINICDSLGINNDDKIIILSIFRWETGHGKSSLCVNYNNYGGIKISNNKFGKFQTPEFGMYCAIKCMYKHILNSRLKLECSSIYDVIYDMSYVYCPGTHEDWAKNIVSMSNNITLNSKNKTQKNNIFIN